MKEIVEFIGLTNKHRKTAFRRASSRRHAQERMRDEHGGRGLEKSCFSVFMSVIATLLLVLMVLTPWYLVSAQENSADSLKSYTRDVVLDIGDEVFEGIQKTIGPLCDLYGVGVDLVNSVEWSHWESLGEMSALFRNRPWRELLWAVTDQHQAYLAELAKLKKRNCLLEFALGAAGALGGPEAKQNFERIQEGIKKRIAEFDEKVKYFGLQRRHLLWSAPSFPDLSQEKEERSIRLQTEAFEAWEKPKTDKIFYWLVDPTSLFPDIGDQIATESVNFAKRVYEADFGAFLGHIPSTCLDSTELLEQIRRQFDARFKPFVDDTGLEKYVGLSMKGERQEVLNFRQFVEKNQKELEAAFVDKLCEKKIPPPSKTSAEEQYEKFSFSLEAILEKLSIRLEEIDQKLTEFEAKQRNTKERFTNADVSTMDDLRNYRGRLIAQIDYYSLVFSVVPPPGSDGLSAIARSLSDFVEAVLGLEKTEEGGVRSRLNLSERTKKIREKKLQELCSRLEEMYRASGRDVSQLPEIGIANDTLYCQPKSECEELLIKKNPGISTAIHAAMECEQKEKLEPDKATQQAAERASEDIGYLLEKAAYEDLLKARALHFDDLRDRYHDVFGAQQDTTEVLSRALTETAKNLFHAGNISNYDVDVSASQKSQYNVLGKVYDEVAAFMRQQKGPSCDAPDTMPPE